MKNAIDHRVEQETDKAINKIADEIIIKHGFFFKGAAANRLFVPNSTDFAPAPLR